MYFLISFAFWVPLMTVCVLFLKQSIVKAVFPIFYAINLSFHFITFHSVLPWCYSISSVCLTLTQMHLPQSLQLHRINGFARFFHGFFSVLLLHSGHTSKLQFFHCFSIVSRVLYAIMVPHRSLNFTWHHFTLSLFFPPFFLAYQFSKRSTQIFHCFPIFSHCFIS